MYNDYSFATSHEDLAIIFGMFSGVIILLSVAVSIFMLVVQWRLFKKAGDKGWKILIPIYNIYTYYKLFWAPRWFWITFLLGVATVMTGAMLTPETAVLMGIVSTVAAIGSGIIGIVSCVKMARSFGQGGAFAVGLIFVGPVFQAILAFGRYEYVGPGGIPGDTQA